MRKQLALALSVAGVGFAIVALPSTTADPGAKASATKRVEVGDLYFRPKSVTVQSGDTVRWVWVGRAPHNVTVTRGPRKFRSTTKTSGVYAKRLRRRGTYRYFCTVHPDPMKGRVVVK
jgi:plastocyanin